MDYQILKNELDAAVIKKKHISITEFKPADSKNEVNISGADLKGKLRLFLGDSKNLLIIVNDAMRATQTAKVLYELKEVITEKDYKILIATGSHRPSNDEEIQLILGEIYDNARDKVINHDSRDESENIYLGNTEKGTEVFINRLVKDAEKILIISSVEPHWFAGYTGGRKSLVPGVAGIKTIRDNHQHAMNPNSQVLRLQGNPVHEDIEDALSFINLEKIFSIQLVQDSDNRICGIFTGNIIDSFYEAVQAASEIYAAVSDEQYDCVIAVVPPPLNNNFYQAHKGLENTKSLLKDGGTFIMVADCPAGVGQDAFYKLLIERKESDKKEKREYQLGDHKAYKLIDFLDKNRFILISGQDLPGMDKLGIERYPRITEALETLDDEDSKIAIVRDAGILAVT